MTERIKYAEAQDAARKLMAIVKADRHWNIAIAEGCLPHGWDLAGAEDSDFHPCTIKGFTTAFRTHARRWLTGTYPSNRA